jgi:hypothetical protein
VRDLVLAIEH